MSDFRQPRERRSLYDLSDDDLKCLIKAFKGIQALPPSNPKSFFVLGGYHGQPFRGKGDTDATWWGGYCNHNNVLFPTWHRAYLLELENALRSIPGCENVTLPFWDECFYMETGPIRPQGVPDGPLVPEPFKPVAYIPQILTEPTVILDPKKGPEPNPLYSYRLQQAIEYQAISDNRYTKPVGYNTVRYPLSGLVGTAEDAKNSSIYNATFDQSQQTQILNSNVGAWLRTGVTIPDDKPDAPPDEQTTKPKDTTSVWARIRECLEAPNYTVFSNNASQGEWNERPGQKEHVMSLESPHNAVHLGVGGFYQEDAYNANPEYRQANGDMGANEMAGFDPIFFLHHCFVDYTFWQWQKRHGLTQNGSLTIDSSITAGTTIITTDAGYPLAENVNAENIPVIPLTMDTPLYPFKDPLNNYYTSDSVTNIAELGYSYGLGSLDRLPTRRRATPEELLGDPERRVASKYLISEINRADYAGSFVVRAYAQLPSGKEVEVAREPILSRWHIQGCRNCHDKLEVRSVVPIHQALLDLLQGDNPDHEPTLRVEVQQIDKVLSTRYPGFTGGKGWSDFVGRHGPPEPIVTRLH